MLETCQPRNGGPGSRGQSRVLTHFGKSEGFPRIRGSDLPCDEPGASAGQRVEAPDDDDDDDGVDRGGVECRIAANAVAGLVGEQQKKR